MIKAIIFDFDGVICESIDVKTEAFRKLFEDYPQHQDKIVSYHIVNGGISRYEKFKVIYRDFLKQELTPEKSRELGEKFSEYVVKRVLNSDFVEGAYEFLQKYHKETMFFIASGTPEEELKYIIEKRRLDKFFRGVFGSPMEKDKIINRICKEFNLQKEEVCFVGDAVSDYEGAKMARVRFIGRSAPIDSNPLDDFEIADRIRNFIDLESLLASEKCLQQN